jgi:hypothetical protein
MGGLFLAGRAARPERHRPIAGPAIQVLLLTALPGLGGLLAASMTRPVIAKIGSARACCSPR